MEVDWLDTNTHDLKSFPIWKPYDKNVCRNEVKKIDRTLPHSITNWMTHVMCVSPTEGVGFSKELELSSFQPFFVDIATPYSLKMDETFYLNVNVFNYLNYSLPVSLQH